jgi:membrane protein YdbS with pleckstrin-like domain
MPDLYVSKNKKKAPPKTGQVKGELFSSKTKKEKKEDEVFQQVEKKPLAKAKKEKVKAKEETKKTEIELEETTNPVAAFATKPVGIEFETQEREEEIILLLRKHWLTNVPWILLGGILIFAPLVLRWLPILAFLPTRYQLIGVIIWYLLTTIIIFERFLTWYFNVYIITDERVIDIDFHNLIYKEVADAKVDKIQDVTYRVGGAIRTLFHFGDVFIQTAGTEPNFDFLAIPKPEQVVRILNQLREEEEREFLEGRVR